MTLHNLIGHSARPPVQPNVQSLHDHARNVAELAADFAAPFGGEACAGWLGWWHDAGKAHESVQAYLRGETEAEHGPDHSSVGMLQALDVLPELALNAAGHHGGLMDFDGGDGYTLTDRIAKKKQDERIADALALAQQLLNGLAPALDASTRPAFIRTRHDGELWLRFLHSALVDADCLDTEAHFDPGKAALRGADVSLADLWETLSRSQERLIAGARPSDVNAARAEIYRACVSAADLPPGVFTLTVPTGGGKTRSGMAFALAHALRHDLQRVIVALPYTSIIEQNAQVYRELFGDEAVLEHHSAANAREQGSEETGTERKARLAAENWDAPVVVTTTVQLLESLFANRNSRLRKLHRIAHSVLILDEVQTLPPHLLTPTLDVLRALVRDYGVTVVLSTATPPALAARESFDGLEEVTPIISDPSGLARRLGRVRYEVRAGERWSWQRVAEDMEAAEQALTIVNTKRDAAALLDALDPLRRPLHLSTQLCSAHRRVVLDLVRQRLAAGEPVLLVSTQVVEAGVDIDFPLVLRAVGPLDRIVQAAGRCNREGRLGPEGGRVVVFEPEQGGMPPGAYAAGTRETQALFREDPGLRLDDPQSALRYFRRLYGGRDLDREEVQKLRARLLYEQTARAYRLIDDDGVPVVVDYDDGHALADRVEHKPFVSREDYRALQPFTVTLRQALLDMAVAEHLAREIAPGLFRWEGRYDGRLRGRGLTWDIPTLPETVI